MAVPARGRRFIFATTARRSANLQQEARDLAERHEKEGLFSVDFLGWEDIEDLLRRYPDVEAWYRDERSKDPTPRLDLGRLPIAGPLLIGRETELARLDAAWEDPGLHVLTFVAFGGMGKSALVSHWLDRMSADGPLPTRSAQQRWVAASRRVGRGIQPLGSSFPTSG